MVDNPMRRNVAKTTTALVLGMVLSAPHFQAQAQIQQGTIGRAQDPVSTDYDAQLKRLLGLDRPERTRAAQDLYLRIGQSLATARARLSNVAAVRSGAVDAERKLSENLALDRAAVQVGRIKPGDTTIQTQAAREELASTLALKREIEASLLSSDAEYNRLLHYQKLVSRELR